ncbi:MAG: PorV/PorQ family protein [Elusimicrobia bacterium]|nr:PorV/PorQ family protein [Elusimicrobiota bacterium]
MTLRLRAKRTLWLAAMLAAGGVQARESPGTTAAPVLQIPVGSRPAGMAGAFTAVAEGPYGMHYNPAGLSRSDGHELAFGFVSGFAGNRLQQLGYAGPLRYPGIFSQGATGLGFGLIYSQSGNIEVNRLNSDGSLQSSSELDAGSDLVLSGAYSERLGETPLNIISRDDCALSHSIGAAAKFIRSTLVEQYHANALAADLGYLAECRELGLSAGAVAQHFGQKMRFIDEADPLPATLRTGLALRRAWAQGQFLAAGDAQYLLHEKQIQGLLGLEYQWQGRFAGRAGYRLQDGAPGLTLGFGLRWERFLIDYAWEMAEALSHSHRFSLSYRFGPPPRRESQRGAGPRRESPHRYDESPEPASVDTSAEPPPRRRSRPIPPPEPNDPLPGWIY